MKKGWKFKPPSSLQTLNRKKDYWTVNWGRPGSVLQRSVLLDFHGVESSGGNDHFYKYVYSEGVSYRSWIRYWANLGAGTWILENDVKRERFDEILSKFEGDLRRYSSKGFTEKEHSDAVQRLVNSKVLDAQTNSLLAWDLAVNEGNGAGFRRATDAVDSLRAVRYQDVQALAKDVFQSKKMLRLVQK
jgi:predicted Zn-dependent peptidase